jgi:hypothetical protein
MQVLVTMMLSSDAARVVSAFGGSNDNCYAEAHSIMVG